MHSRNAASVLPEPVGAAINTSSPAAMRGHPSRCGGVGPSGKRRRNHVPTAGWNPSTRAERGTQGELLRAGIDGGHVPRA